MRDELENGTIDVKTGAVNTRARGEDEEEEEEEWLQEFDKQAKVPIRDLVDHSNSFLG